MYRRSTSIFSVVILDVLPSSPSRKRGRGKSPRREPPPAPRAKEPDEPPKFLNEYVDEGEGVVAELEGFEEVSYDGRGCGRVWIVPKNVSAGAVVWDVLVNSVGNRRRPRLNGYKGSRRLRTAARGCAFNRDELRGQRYHMDILCVTDVPEGAIKLLHYLHEF